MFVLLKKIVSEYMETYPESSIKLQRYEETDTYLTPFILAIIALSIKRVHSMVSFSFVYCLWIGTQEHYRFY